MPTERRRPTRDKYREAQFFLQRLERADDGHVRNVRSQTDKDEFRYYCSAFASAVDEIHTHVERVDEDHPAFEEWAADRPLRDLHQFFAQRANDVIDVRPADRQEPDSGPRGTTGLTVESTVGQYCLGDDGVPDTLAMEYGSGRDEGGLSVTDLAEAYLDHVDAWLAELDAETNDTDAPDEG
ncbi:hypothetical protein ACFR9U_13280 [Halorientalis brevis]|uniref:Uncharacterized protein n=1 Tax=Halorientalis brevis TaxID=1126241 RepID=A0ABD6CCH2_9EURY|nr:hypothetical protein [Halorientalis brevis]